MGDTPPVLVAVDPDILQDVTGFQSIAFAFEQMLRRAPALMLLAPPEALRQLARNHEFPSQELIHRVGALHVEPDGPLPACPDGVQARQWLDDAIPQVMQHHVQSHGLTIPVVKIPIRQAASIMHGTIHDALKWAQSIGATRMELWSEHDYIDPDLELKASEAHVALRVHDPRPEAGVQVVE